MKIAVLEICPFEPTNHHKNLFFNKEKEGWHFFYVSHFKPNDEFNNDFFIQKEINDKHFLGNYPNTSWAYTRNILFDKIDKIKYDYYFFIDYDAHLSFNEKAKKTNNLKIRDEFKHYLEKYNPPIAMPYYADDIPKLNNLDKHECSTMLFTNNIIKIIRKDLLNWFLPYNLKYGGTYDACHFFNILEIPFKKWVCCIHSIIVKNQAHNAPHYQNNQAHKQAMEAMYQEFKTAFKWSNVPEKAIDLKILHHQAIQETQIYKNEMAKAMDKCIAELLEGHFDLGHLFFKERVVS